MSKFLKKFWRSWMADVCIFFGFLGGGWAVLNFDLSFLRSISWMGLMEWTDQALIWVSEALEGWEQTIGGSFLMYTAVSVVGFALIYVRVIYHLRGSHRLTHSRCPRCTHPMHRIKRTPFQKALSRVFPLRRFYCPNCSWKGVKLKSHHSLPVEFVDKRNKDGFKLDSKIDVRH